MGAILKVQLQKLRRNPSGIILMIFLTILFTMTLSINVSSKVTIYTYVEEHADEAAANSWLERLNESDTFQFKLTDERTAVNKVVDGEAVYALKLMDDDYRIIAAMDDPNIPPLDSYIRSVFEYELSMEHAESLIQGVDIRQELDIRSKDPVLTVHSTSIESADGFRYDTRIHSLFGFSLFFSFYTIAYMVNELLYDKRNRIWDRVILSPVRKTSMYLGHLINSFLTGYLQIVLVFSLFRYVFDFPIADSFGTILIIAALYTFSIVALGMLLAGLVRTPQQMNVLTPIVGVSAAMIGGAYWPIEIVTNPFLLGLSKIVPTTYAMDALKGVVYYAYTWSELLEPMAFMGLIGVICMGVGINLMERRAV